MAKANMNKFIGFILILSLMVGISVPVYASSDYTFSLSADKSTVMVGDTLRVTLTVSRNDGQQTDLCAMQDYIVFDPEYFSVNEASYDILQSTDSVPYDLFNAKAMSFGGKPTDRIYVSHASASPVSLPSEINVISFELTALKEGTSTITHDTIEVVGENMRVYNVASDTLSIAVSSMAPGIAGDVNMDGIISANDAAITLKKTLNNAFKMPCEQYLSDAYMLIVDVNADNMITSSDSAYIIQKTLDNSFRLPVEDIREE